LPRITGYDFNGKGALLECSASLICTGNVSLLDFVTEFCGFLRARRKYWLIPMLITIGIFGGALLLANGSAVAPFIYTLF
jgi:hypothetical protein